MSPIHRLCPKCGALVGPLAGLCPGCTKADNGRRNAKRKASGRATPQWQRLRAAAIERSGYRCERCGKPGTSPTLTAHLRPDLGGNHRIARREDITVLCRSCHGTIDAPRATQARIANRTGFLKARSSLPVSEGREKNCRDGNGEARQVGPSVG